VSGKHVTHEYVVEGPVMIFLTTTAHEVDEELLNRCIVLTVNEDREQTRAIHQKQRESQTLEGLKARMRQNKIIRLHRNVQRLLRPIQVVIEHLKDHSFPDAMTRTRRDHMKFLTLIQAVTLLHQHQREIKTSTEDGETLEYIEATEADVKLAWELTNHVLVRSLDDVPPQTRRLLLLIDKMVTEECKRLEIERLDYRFTRATVRRFTGWGDSQLKKHLSRLEDLEYLALHRGAPGQSFVYALNFEMDENGRPVLPGLSYGANRSRFTEGVSGLNEGVAPSSHGQVTGVARGGHDAKSPAMTRAGEGFSEKSRKNTSRDAAPPESLPDAIVVAGKSNGANGHAREIAMDRLFLNDSTSLPLRGQSQDTRGMHGSVQYPPGVKGFDNLLVMPAFLVLSFLDKGSQAAAPTGTLVSAYIQGDLTLDRESVRQLQVADVTAHVFIYFPADRLTRFLCADCSKGKKAGDPASAPLVTKPVFLGSVEITRLTFESYARVDLPPGSFWVHSSG
jgi:hypothetical protein